MPLDFSNIYFAKYDTQLDEFIAASYTMDEKTFRVAYENLKCELPLVFMSPIAGELYLYS